MRFCKATYPLLSVMEVAKWTAHTFWSPPSSSPHPMTNPEDIAFQNFPAARGQRWREKLQNCLVQQSPTFWPQGPVWWKTVFPWTSGERWGMVWGWFNLCNPTDYSPQAPLSMGFAKKEYWSGLPFHSPRYLTDSGIKPWSLALQQILHLSHQEYKH